MQDNQNTEAQQSADVAPTRKRWETPALTRIDAGDAEIGGYYLPDLNNTGS